MRVKFKIASGKGTFSPVRLYLARGPTKPLMYAVYQRIYGSEECKLNYTFCSVDRKNLKYVMKGRRNNFELCHIQLL